MRATSGALDQRWIELRRLFANALGLRDDGRDIRIETDYAAEAAWAGFTGIACEKVTRSRGGTTWVAPLCKMPADLHAWLGWQEVWRRVAGPKPFQFRNVGLTVYVGRRNEAIKPQFIRLEWPGISNWSGNDLSFQSPGAGHPHWQVDLLQSLKRSAAPADFDPDPIELVEDFEVAAELPRVDELLRSLSVERMHLASAAPWWLVPTSEVGSHMNAPPDLPALSRWLERSVLYLQQELQRCVLQP